MYEYEADGKTLKFKTDARTFSPLRPDKGTLAMLARAELSPRDRLLDLGCGYGFVGIYAAALYGCETLMSDSDELCAELARENCALNGLSDVGVIRSFAFREIDASGFTKILCNPPYHADFSVAKEFIEKGFNRLAVGGKMFMVTKRLDWYKNKLGAIFGGAKAYYEDGGYFVFEAEKRRLDYSKKRGNGRT